MRTSRVELSSGAIIECDVETEAAIEILCQGAVTCHTLHGEKYTV
jgi:hypothetical protein